MSKGGRHTGRTINYNQTVQGKNKPSEWNAEWSTVTANVHGPDAPRSVRPRSVSTSDACAAVVGGQMPLTGSVSMPAPLMVVKVTFKGEV